MSYTVVVYYPEIEKRQPGLPFGQMGDRLFWYPINRGGTPSAKKMERVELGAVVLRKGTNFVNAEEWKTVVEEPTNNKEVDRLKKCVAINIYNPDNPEESGKDTTDFADESVIAEIIENISDLDWLQLSLHADRRISVRKLLGDRIKEVNDDKSIMQQKLSGSFGN